MGMIQFSRMPKEFVNALEQGRHLEVVREKMKKAGCPCILSTHGGAKVFVWPEQYQTVLHAVGGLSRKLFTSHVIILESLLPRLEDIVAEIPASKEIRKKGSPELLTRVASATDGCS